MTGRIGTGRRWGYTGTVGPGSATTASLTEAVTTLRGPPGQTVSNIAKVILGQKNKTDKQNKKEIEKNKLENQSAGTHQQYIAL